MPKTYLVLVGSPHLLDNFLRLGLWDAPFPSNDLDQDSVDLARHMGSVATDIEVRLLFQKLVDLFGALLQSVLDIDLLGIFARECRHELKFVAQILLGFLQRG